MAFVEAIGILIGPKGRGSNLRAIVEASIREDFPAEVKVVISPLNSIPAVHYARNQNLLVDVIPPGERYSERLRESLQTCSVVCLAGYTRLLPEDVLDAHLGRVLNIHPALLPSYGGKGMYGMHVHRAVIEKHEKESGCTVHLVTPVYDEGEIILQKKCPVYESDTPEELAARVLELEKIAYPEAIRKFIYGQTS